MDPILKVLLVEDNPGDARLISEMFAETGGGALLETVETLAAAVGRLEADRFDAVLLDLGLPDSKGLQTFTRLHDAAPKVATIVLSGNTDTRDAMSTIESGAQDFLVKGRVDSEQLSRSVRYAVGRCLVEQALRDSEARLHSMVYAVAESMGQAVEARDPYTQGHQVRVAELACAIATRLGMSSDDIAGVNMAALVHDVGKLRVPAEILTKPGRLSKAEFNLILEHPKHSHEILQGINFPWPIAETCLQHHERMDGSGYPRGLVGEEILLQARIIGVADVVEAMASHRPYRPALGLDVAIDEIRSNPTKFDADVSSACFALYDEGLIKL